MTWELLTRGRKRADLIDSLTHSKHHDPSPPPCPSVSTRKGPITARGDVHTWQPSPQKAQVGGCTIQSQLGQLNETLCLKRKF